MKKTGGIILVGVLAVLIGTVISLQISTINGAETGALIPVAKLQQYDIALQQARAEREAAVQELIALEERLTVLQQEKAEEDDILRVMLADEEKYKMAAGLVEVKGPGVVITLEDPIANEYSDGYSEIMVNYDMILNLINRLKDAGAEAISINGQRIIASTEISLAGDNVNINSVPTAAPYTIKAIGNPQTIESAITIRYGIVEYMREHFGIRVTIAKQEEVVIPRYSGVIRFRYARPVTGDGDNITDQIDTSIDDDLLDARAGEGRG